MSGIQLNSLTAAGNAATASIASSLIPKKNAVPAAATSGTTGSGSSSSTTASSNGDITSTDFLTLLVSELKNQDPTQPTDPNAYITQLAQVNSLQQLININTGITTLDNAVTPTTTSSSGSTSGTGSGSNS